jgi:argininosuccinate synthase
VFEQVESKTVSGRFIANNGGGFNEPVNVEVIGRGDNAKAYYRAKIGADGSFVFKLPVGDYRILANVDYYNYAFDNDYTVNTDLSNLTLKFEKGRCVAVNGKKMSPLEVMVFLNKVGGKNGIGMKHALENRIIGTKSRGVYEAPGMEVLSWGLKYIYEGIMDRRSTDLFQKLSKFVSDQIYDGRWFDPATEAARAAIQVWADKATAEVTLGLYKGNIYFESLKGLKSTIYNEADSSMEESDGLNPHSSQGFAEIQSVEAKMLAKSGQIKA